MLTKTRMRIKGKMKYYCTLKVRRKMKSNKTHHHGPMGMSNSTETKLMSALPHCNSTLKQMSQINKHVDLSKKNEAEECYGKLFTMTPNWRHHHLSLAQCLIHLWYFHTNTVCAWQKGEQGHTQCGQNSRHFIG